VEAFLGGNGGGFPPFPGAQRPWSDESLAAAVGEAVLAALRELGAVPRAEGALHVGTRSGGYVRAFLKEASTEASAVFSTALHEALGPLDHPRYVIPRSVDFVEDTWLSRILPRLVGRYFQRSTRTLQMLHAVPSVFAKSKELAQIYQRHWNAHVSPGEAVFAHRGEGERLLDDMRQSGRVPEIAAPSKGGVLAGARLGADRHWHPHAGLRYALTFNSSLPAHCSIRAHCRTGQRAEV
jgi:hypothetical protein